MGDPERRIVEFDRLNWAGRAVYIGGLVAKTVGTVLDATVERVADLIGDAETAFREAMDGDVEDAKILDERTESDSDGPNDPPHRSADSGKEA